MKKGVPVFNSHENRCGIIVELFIKRGQSRGSDISSAPGCLSVRESKVFSKFGQMILVPSLRWVTTKTSFLTFNNAVTVKARHRKGDEHIHGGTGIHPVYRALLRRFGCAMRRGWLTSRGVSTVAWFRGSECGRVELRPSYVVNCMIRFCGDVGLEMFHFPDLLSHLLES